MEVVRSKVKEWDEKGFVENLEQPALCNNPLSLAAKFDHQAGEIK
jgi:hypothetical protein